jgi:hypothetical protein
MPLTVLEGSTFCMCDELGDLGAATTGFFADDTRVFVHRFVPETKARMFPEIEAELRARFVRARFSPSGVG